MLKFQIISDIHFEEHKGVNLKHFEVLADVLIIAGDLGRVENYKTYADYIKYFCSVFKKVILVPGNHEYYSTRMCLTFSEVNDLLKGLTGIFYNLEVLLDESIVLGNVRIHGGTFWSFCPEGWMKKLKIHYKSSDRFITREEYNSLHYKAIEEVRNSISLAEKNNEILIVVTHHAPVFKGVFTEKHQNIGFLESPNRMYFSHNDLLLDHPVVKKWVYGHTGYNGRYGKLVTQQMDVPSMVHNLVIRVEKIASKL